MTFDYNELEEFANEGAKIGVYIGAGVGLLLGAYAGLELGNEINQTLQIDPLAAKVALYATTIAIPAKVGEYALAIGGGLVGKLSAGLLYMSVETSKYLFEKAINNVQ